ncbi:MAG: hypothetical protein JWL90_4424 [Chthoniobacteraceae bacterium]|nr:hypothetical protein [Chthoniobacteraceae bacterium]
MSKKSIRPLPEGIVIGLITLIAISVNVNWTYQRAREALEGEIKEGLLRTVSATARMLDGRLAEQHKDFHPIERAGACDYASQWIRLQTDKEFIDWRAATMATPTYAEWKLRMEEVRKATAHVRWLYTCVLIRENVYFAFNEATQNDIANNITGEAKPDGLLDPAPNLLWPYPDAGESQIKALRNEIACVDSQPYTDTWGTYYSGYAPFFDSNGKMVGTIGMDLETTGFNERMAPVVIASKRAAVTGLCVAILSGVVIWFVRRLCSHLWMRAGSGDGARGQDTASLQNAQSAYAARLLQTFYLGADGSQQLVSLHRVVESGRAIGANENTNFQSAAIETLIRDHGQTLGSEVEVTLDPEVPEILHAPTERLAAALVDCLEGLKGAGLHLRISMEEEKIQWLTLVARFSQASNEYNRGPEGVVDCLAENRIELASAQAHVRAMRGELIAQRSAQGFEVVLRIPMRKSQPLPQEA